MKTPSLLLLLIAALLSTWVIPDVAFAVERGGTLASPEQLLALELTDVEGNTHGIFADESTTAVALIFVSTDCPIANSFQPWIKKIHESYAGKPVKFFMVHSTTMSSQEAVEKHISDFEIEMPVVLDDKQAVGRMVKAKTTPEAVVIDRKGAIRYRGLINNLYSGFGERRPEPTEHYLTNALDALIDDKPVATASTKPFGCLIYYARVRNR